MSIQINNKNFIPITLASIILIGLILLTIYKIQIKDLNRTIDSNIEKSDELENIEDSSKFNNQKEDTPLTIYKDSVSSLISKIDSLENTVITLKKKKDTIIYKEKIIVEKVPEYIYREKQEHYRFGKDKGKIIIYSVCDPRTIRQIFIDGKSVGSISKYYTNGRPNCNSNDSSAKVNLIISSGKHHIEIKDKTNWEFYTDIKENECNFVPLGCN